MFAGGLDSVHSGHADVHQDDVRLELARAGDGFGPVACLADDVHVRFRFEDHPEARSDEALVVCQEDADHGSVRNGSRTRSA